MFKGENVFPFLGGFQHSILPSLIDMTNLCQNLSLQQKSALTYMRYTIRKE